MHSRRNRPRRFSLRADGGMAANVHRAAETRFYDSEGRMSGYVLSNAVGCGVSVAFAYDGPYLTNAIHTLPCGNRFAARLTRATARTDLVTPCAQIFGGQSMYWLLTAYDLLGRPTSTTDSVSLAREWLYDRRSGLTKATVGTPDIFRHRFSTKHLDSGTGLYHYGYRFYVPSLMRWLNRDPIGERGGANIYGFCGNSPICRYDKYGWAHFEVRRLSGLPAILSYSCFAQIIGAVPAVILDFGLADKLNIEILHEHLFYDDGTNIGYSKEGFLTKESKERYSRRDCREYDDCIMKEAQARVMPPPYSLLGLGRPKYNCQDYANSLRRMYDAIKDDPAVKCKCRKGQQ